MEKKQIVDALLKNGAKMVKNVVVRNVTVTPQENYVRLGLTLDQEVDGYIQNEEGEFVQSKTKVIFVSAFSISSLLKDNDEAAFAASHIIAHPESMGIILSRAKIDVIQEPVKAESEYKSPWSETAESRLFDHDTIINHVVSLELSDFAVRKLDTLADKLMGF